jgi:cytochrome P450 enzyme
MSGAETIRFEPFDPDYVADPYPVYRRLREEAPIYYWPSADAWVLSRYDDCLALLRDRRFSLSLSDWEHAPPKEQNAYQKMMDHMLFGIGERDHTRIRKLASPAFTPRAIESMREKTQRIVDSVLDRIGGRDECDVVNDFSEQIPLRVIGEVLGVPFELEAAFRDFGGAVVESINPWLTPEDKARVHALIPDGIALVERLIDERRGHPGADLLSTLIHYEEEGERLSTDELVSLVAAIVIAGAETTTHLLSFSVWNLLRHPSQLERLRASWSLLTPMLEEVLRYDSFGKVGNPRFAREPMKLRDVDVRKGQMVMALAPAALRDPAAFADPDVFDIGRDPAKNFSFGSGAHYCLGVNLARLEGEVALGTLLMRFPKLRLLSPPAYQYGHASMRKMTELRVGLR